MITAGAQRAPANGEATRQHGPTVRGQSEQHMVVVGMPRTAKVIRVGIMSHALLEELRHTVLDEAGRARVRVVFDTTLGELAGCLPEAVAAELGRLVPALGEGVPSQSELRLAEAQLSGWLEGMLQSIQMAVNVQQAAALQQLAASGPGPRQPPSEPAPATPAGPYL
jgi:hypothetical protein